MSSTYINCKKKRKKYTSALLFCLLLIKTHNTLLGRKCTSLNIDANYKQMPNKKQVKILIQL